MDEIVGNKNSGSYGKVNLFYYFKEWPEEKKDYCIRIEDLGLHHGNP